MALRNRWYDHQTAEDPPLPTVSVGNLSVGGTGKTPVVRALAKWYEARDHRAGVVTRGYGADEVSMYRRWLGAERVVVASQRREGLVRAAGAGWTVALLDDGFQHRRASRSLDVLLVSADAPHPVRLLPSGPYREPLRSAGRADLILVTHRPGGEAPDRWRNLMEKAAPAVPVLPLALGGLGWRRLGDPRTLQDRGGGADEGAADGRGEIAGSVLAVASTADPAGFRRMIRATRPDLEVELAPFPDHHGYRADEVVELARRAGERPILTTEKDGVKLASFQPLRDRTWVVGFGVVGPLPDELTSRLQRVVEGGAS